MLTELGHLPWSLFWQIVLLLFIVMILLSAVKKS